MPVDLQPAHPVAFICAVLADGEQTIATATDHLSDRFGPLRAASAIYPFDYTAYYAGEMGDGLIKQLLCFEQLVDPSTLAAAKTQTIEIEKAMARNGARRANIDPGLLSIEGLVLATTKYSGHRICIASSLYAELTLLYQRGQYQPLEWTYPDYRSEAVQRFLLTARSWLLHGR